MSHLDQELPAGDSFQLGGLIQGHCPVALLFQLEVRQLTAPVPSAQQFASSDKICYSAAANRLMCGQLS